MTSTHIHKLRPDATILKELNSEIKIFLPLYNELIL